MSPTLPTKSDGKGATEVNSMFAHASDCKANTPLTEAVLTGSACLLRVAHSVTGQNTEGTLNRAFALIVRPPFDYRL